MQGKEPEEKEEEKEEGKEGGERKGEGEGKIAIVEVVVKSLGLHAYSGNRFIIKSDYKKQKSWI